MRFRDIDVLIVGGGISGLAIGSVLADAGLTVQVWEKATHPGGKIQSDKHGGYLTERGASQVLNFYPEVSRLLAKSGLTGQKVNPPGRNQRYLVHNGSLTAMSARFATIFRSPLWSTKAKLRMAMEPFIPKGGSENETVSQFIIRRLGVELLERGLDPYVGGPLASDPDLANAWTSLPRLTKLERHYGSLTLGMIVRRVLGRSAAGNSEVFSFRDGMAALTHSLAATLGPRLVTDCEVQELNSDQSGWHVCGNTDRGPRELLARELVLSIPAGGAAGLLAELDGELTHLLRGIEYAPLVAVHTGLDADSVRHPLDGNGFLAPRSERLALNGCLWTTSMFPGRAPVGKVLLTSYAGGARQPAAIDWGDSQCVDEVMCTLAPLLGVRGEPEMVRVDRHAQGLPLYHGHYYRRLQAIDARLAELPGLHLEANYRGGVAVRDRIARAFAVADTIRNRLADIDRPIVQRLPMRVPKANPGSAWLGCEGDAAR